MLKHEAIAFLPKGPHFTGFVGPCKAITGVCTAQAMCIKPVFPLTKIDACFIIAAISFNDNDGKIMHLEFLKVFIISGSCAFPEIRIFILKFSNIFSASLAKFSTGQRL